MTLVLSVENDSEMVAGQLEQDLFRKQPPPELRDAFQDNS